MNLGGLIRLITSDDRLASVNRVRVDSGLRIEGKRVQVEEVKGSGKLDVRAKMGTQTVEVSLGPTSRHLCCFVRVDEVETRELETFPPILLRRFRFVVPQNTIHRLVTPSASSCPR